MLVFFSLIPFPKQVLGTLEQFPYNTTFSVFQKRKEKSQFLNCLMLKIIVNGSIMFYVFKQLMHIKHLALETVETQSY